MRPEQLLEFIDQGRAMLVKSIDPEESLKAAEEEHILCDGDTPEKAQQHYFNTGLTIIKSAIEVHLRERRRDIQGLVPNPKPL